MDKAHEQTDKEIEILLKQIDKIYKKNEAECNKPLQDYLDSVKPVIDKYYKQYLDAQKDGIDVTKAKDAYIAELKSVTIESQDYIDAVKKTAQKNTILNSKTLLVANAVLATVYANNFNYSVNQTREKIGNTSIGIGISFKILDTDTVKRLAKSKKINLPTKKLDKSKDQKWNVKRINSQLSQGILKGEAIPELADRLQSVSDMNRVSAERNARTMCTSAENQSRLDHLERLNKAGIQVQKEWVATLDERTRAWHAELDGQKIDWDESFHNEYGDIKFPGDPEADPANVYNCRCAIVQDYSKVVDEDDEGERRDNITGDTIPYMTYNDWMKGM